MNSRVHGHHIATGNGIGFGTNANYIGGGWGDGAEGNGCGTNTDRSYMREFQHISSYNLFSVEILYEQ